MIKFISPCNTVLVTNVQKVFRKEGKSANKVTSSAKDGAGNENELIEIA